MNELTSRDRKYMRAVYLLNGHKKPVGPAKLAQYMEVSRVGALQKLKRLETFKVGNYIENKGLKLNKKGIKIIEEDIWRHHVLENFFIKQLDMKFSQACEESSKLGNIISDELIRNIYESIDGTIECKCGLCLDPPYEPQKLKKCHWFKNQFPMVDKGVGKDD